MGIIHFFEWHRQYQIGIAVVRDHDVLVSTAGTDGEATCVVSIKFNDGRDSDNELVGV